MTKTELIEALRSIPKSADILIVVDGREIPLTSVEVSYEGFCEPQYTVRISGADQPEG